MTGERFTAYLTPAERAELRRRAAENDVSENIVLRVALRRAWGLEIPAWAEPLLSGGPLTQRQAQRMIAESQRGAHAA